MNYGYINDSTLRELINNDPDFKKVFEDKVKEKILAALDGIDISKEVTTAMKDLIRYMFIDDSYIYEDVRDMISTIIEDNVRISFGGKEVFNHDEESVED
jgi:hypothetical protein